MVKWCPACNMQITHNIHNTEMNHKCNSGDPAIDNEDVRQLGSWTDDSGSGRVGPHFMQIGGVGNELQGTIGDWTGSKDSTRTDRGHPEQLVRTRPRIHNATFH